MAHGDYYNPDNKVVVAGNIVYASDLNSINSAVDSAFAQVASDLDDLENVGVLAEAQAWASADQGVRPDNLIAAYSSKAYATEAKEYATNSQGVAIHKADGTTQVIASALVSATAAAASASSASSSASTAGTQANTATTQAGIATTQAGLAAASASNALTSENNAAASASIFTANNILTSIKTVDGAGSGLDADLLDGQQGSVYARLASPTFTGTVGGITATMVGLGNVTNTSDANKPVSTAQQTALNLKANLASPTFTGTITTPEVTFPDGSKQVTAHRSFRNKIINGDMAVDQEFAGVSTVVTAGAALKYLIDQWYGFSVGANITGQQVSGPITNTYRYRLTGASSVSVVGFGQRLEAINTAYMAGSVVTLQALLSSSSLTSINWTVYYASTKDTFGSLASPTRTQVDTGSFTINSTETRYSAQITLPSAATTGLEVVFTGGALLGSQTLTIGNVQLEKAGAPSEFEYVPYDESLRRCQRYWEKSNDKVPAMVLPVLVSRAGILSSDFVVQKRVVPVMSVQSGSVGTANKVSDYSSEVEYVLATFTGATVTNLPGWLQTSTSMTSGSLVTFYWQANARL